MNATTDCDCSPDYGPCDDHSLVAVIREGASTRTADESLELFAHDAASILEARVNGWQLSTDDVDLLRDAARLLAESDGYCAWIPEGDESDAVRDGLIDLGDRLESELATVGYWVTRDDGYIVSWIAGGPLGEYVGE